MKQTRALISFRLNGVRRSVSGVIAHVYLRAAATALLTFVSVNARALDVVYVMRHAQKEEVSKWTGPDEFRPLTEKGVRCAKQRAERLKEKGIVAVYANETVRTLATGMAVSYAIPDIEIIGDDKTRGSDIDKYLKERHPSPKEGGPTAILIVSQSGGIKNLILAFRPDDKGCLPRLGLLDPFPQSQYGDLWVIDLRVPGCEGISREAPLALDSGNDRDCSTPG